MVQPYFPIQPSAPLLPYSLELDVPIPTHKQFSGLIAAFRQPLVWSVVTDVLVPFLPGSLPPFPFYCYTHLVCSLVSLRLPRTQHPCLCANHSMTMSSMSY